MSPSDLRRCGRCGCDKPVAEYDIRKKGGWQGYCKPCHKAYKQDYYQRNRAKYLSRALAHKAQLKLIVRSAKGCPCADCGKTYAAYVMDFDHREGEVKLFNVADLGADRWVSLKLLRAEIAKCDVVCANCHRERTYQRRLRKAAAKT